MGIQRRCKFARLFFRGLILALCLAGALAQAGAVRELDGFCATVYGPNDDGSYPCTSMYAGIPSSGPPLAVAIGFNVNFYGNSFSNLYVNNNGNITFDQPLGLFTPFGLVNTASQIIAPFFADVDTRAGTNYVTFGNDVVDGHPAFGVNWVGVGYFDMNTDKLNSFQLVLIERSDRNPGDFDVEFNYDVVQWETGDDSDGIDGLGGHSAVAGFSNGSGLPGTSLQLAGSGNPGKFLDLNPNGLAHGSMNSAIPGRYIFSIVNLTNFVLGIPRLAQGDPRWASQSYAGTPATIKQQGSALTTLAMALSYAGVPAAPGSLDTLLVQSNDFVGNDVNWDPATRDASQEKLRFVAQRTSNAQYLSQTLGNGYPVVAGVELNGDGRPGHFVLVIGESDGHFLINDPGQADATNLDYYHNCFETRGYLAPWAGDASGFDLSVDNPAEIFVVDPLGRQTGYDPASGTVLEGILQSAHFADCPETSDGNGGQGKSTAHLVPIYQPLLGHYQIYLRGINTASAHLYLRSFLSDGTPGTSPSLTVTNASSTLAAYQVCLSATGAAFEPFTNSYAWSVSPTNGAWPLAVEFAGSSTDNDDNTITNWYWNFGDGAISTESNPAHTYTATAGTLFPSVIAVNQEGDAIVSFGPSVVIERTNLVLNGDFELWDYSLDFAPTAWTVGGDADVNDGSVMGFTPYPGSSCVAMSSDGSPGDLYQTFPTVPGAAYQVSVWLISNAATPNNFSISWDSILLFNQTNFVDTDWTNLQFMVLADASAATLDFQFEDSGGALGLDGVRVLPQTTVTGIEPAGSNLVIAGGNGFAGGTCVTLTTTNLKLAPDEWAPVATNSLQTDGEFTFTATNVINPGARQQFYRLQMQ
jgi:hypothetical protein